MTILNIVTLPQRKQQIESEVARMGIEALYWPSIPDKSSITSISKSHKRIVQFAKDNNLPEICIGEDDLLFTSKYSWNYFLKQKPADFDLYLGGVYGGVPFPDNSLYGFAGLHLYIVAARYYDTFLATREDSNIDKEQRGKGRFILCNPQIAKQRNGYSYHRKEIVDDDHYLKDMMFLTD